MGLVTYCQVRDIINEETNDRIKVFCEEGVTCHATSFFVLTWIC
jgi:hypothetical protein